MIKFSMKINNFSILTERLLKSEALCVLFNTAFPRTLVTKSALLFNRNVIKKVGNLQNRNSVNINEKFGEIVDLDVDFEDVKIKTGRKRNNKNLKLDDVKVDSGSQNIEVHDDVKVDSDSQNIEVDDNIQLEKKNNLKVSSQEPNLKNLNLKNNSKIMSSTVIKLKSRKFREKHQEVLLEGKRLIYDAISAGFSPSKVFFSRASDVEKLCLPKKTSLYRVPYKSFNLWSDLVTSQGVMAVFKIPQLNIKNNNYSSIPLTVICDNIRDPGNLGSILRVVASVGCKKLLLTKGCVDIWEPKVLRSGAGAHFRLPLINNLQWSDIETKISEDSKIILADFGKLFSYKGVFKGDGDPENETNEMQTQIQYKNELSETLPIHCYDSVKYGKEDAVIIIGGETHGMSDEAYKFAVKRKGIRIFIPMNNDIESLNNSVALGILCYEFRRQFDFICNERFTSQETDSGQCESEA